MVCVATPNARAATGTQCPAFAVIDAAAWCSAGLVSPALGYPCPAPCQALPCVRPGNLGTVSEPLALVFLLCAAMAVTAAFDTAWAGGESSCSHLAVGCSCSCALQCLCCACPVHSSAWQQLQEQSSLCQDEQVQQSLSGEGC